MQRHHLFSSFGRWDYFLAFCCAIAFVVALVGGSGLGSVKYVAWGAWWLFIAQRLRREELGLAPRRGD